MRSGAILHKLLLGLLGLIALLWGLIQLDAWQTTRQAERIEQQERDETPPPSPSELDR